MDALITSLVSCWIVFGLCSAASGVGASQKIIKAESGQSVSLTCRAPNNMINILEWSRADLGKQSVLVQRDGHFVPELQHPSFKNRVELQDSQMKDGDVSLILKNVTINDTGRYECRVKTNRRKRANLKTDPISIVYLRVSAPPGPGGGTSEDGEKKDGGKKDGGKDGSVGLRVGVSVSALLLLVAVVGFLIFRKCKQSRGSYHP